MNTIDDRPQEPPQELVSIIMPAYNCQDVIDTTIDSVIAQTYKNWELIIVNDGSSDDTESIVQKYLKQEPRIKYIKLDDNYGAAVARNTAVEKAQGRYLAFLDSDDLWLPQKLVKQVSFMEQNGYSLTCSSYSKIDMDGNPLNQIIHARPKMDYNDVLKNCPGNSTVIYDAYTLGKHTIPNIRKRNDYVMWLQIIKQAGFLYGMDEPLGCHRLRAGSLSDNKAALVRYQWRVYRKIEKLSVFKALYLLIYIVSKKIFKFSSGKAPARKTSDTHNQCASSDNSKEKAG